MRPTGGGGGRDSHLHCIARELGSREQTPVCFRKTGISAEVTEEESRLVGDTAI